MQKRRLRRQRLRRRQPTINWLRRQRRPRRWSRTRTALLSTAPQVRAAQDEGFLARSDHQDRLWQGGLLLQHGTAQLRIEAYPPPPPPPEAPGGDAGQHEDHSHELSHEVRGIDVIVVAPSEAEMWRGLASARDLVLGVLQDCSPGERCAGVPLDPSSP